MLIATLHPTPPISAFSVAWSFDFNSLRAFNRKLADLRRHKGRLDPKLFGADGEAPNSVREALGGSGIYSLVCSPS